ncbi:MAG: exonuclease SbcCD subunit D [bacterium]|nr:exonuclease SbcCD subunit D [bacterium]
MRLLHLGDLHIGKKVNGYSMIDDQRAVLAEIVELAKVKGVAAVLIAGDIYDKEQPSAEAARLYDEFITSLHESGIAVLAVPGNHDSASRISVLSSILGSKGVSIAKPFSGVVERCELHDEHGAINVYLLPFINPSIARTALPDTEIKSWPDALRAVIGTIALDESARNILVAHQFVIGGSEAELSESETRTIGAADEVPSDVFDAFDYVALGHLHKPQWVVKGKMRYSGSPLKYSFSELKPNKTATLVELGKKGDISFEMPELHPLHDMLELEGTIAEMREYAQAHPESADCYVHVTLTKEDLQAFAKLKDIFPLLMRLDFKAIESRRRASTRSISSSDIASIGQLEMIQMFFQEINGRDMDEAELEIIGELGLDGEEGGAR